MSHAWNFRLKEALQLILTALEKVSHSSQANHESPKQAVKRENLMEIYLTDLLHNLPPQVRVIKYNETSVERRIGNEVWDINMVRDYVDSIKSENN